MSWGTLPSVHRLAAVCLVLLGTGCDTASKSQTVTIPPRDPVPWTITVVAPDGTPAPAAKVYIAEKGQSLAFVDNENGQPVREPVPVGVTDVNGQLTTSLPFDGATIVVRHARGYRALTMKYPTTPSRIELQPWGRIEGTLRRGSLPYMSATLEAVNDTGILTSRHVPGVLYALHTRSDAAGHYVFSRVPPGGFEVSPPYAGALLHSVWMLDVRGYAVVMPGETARLYTGGVGRAVAGRVTASVPGRWLAIGQIVTRPGLPSPTRPADQDYTPETLAYFWAAKEWHDGRRSHAFLADASGRFHVDDLPPGDYTLRVYCFDSLQAAEYFKRPVAANYADFTVFTPAANETAWDVQRLKDLHAITMLPTTPNIFRPPQAPAEVSSAADRP